MCSSPWFWLLSLAMCAKGAWCLRKVSLHVPQNVAVGESIRLVCRFDLEGDTLYSIKWYRNEVEFFRYVPRDRPPGQFFPMEGVRVDIFRSSNDSILLENIDYGTSGTYRCEVSADAPSFQTESASTKLIVKEFSDSGCSCHRPSLFSIAGFLSILLAFLC